MNAVSAPDWSVHLLQLAARGALGRVERGREAGRRGGELWLDLPALAQAWGCDTGLCTPGRRAADARSCCADLEVVPSPEERAAIEAALPEIAAFLSSDDPRWARPRAPFAGDALDRAGRRCIFARLDADGSQAGRLSCGLHALEDATGRRRGALKPLACRLFPLVEVDAEAGRTLLTAISGRTWRLAESRPARSFPCIGSGAMTIAEACADTLDAQFGAVAAQRTIRAVRQWLAERRTIG